MRYSKWLLAAAFLASGTPAHAQVSGIFLFGDSNVDSGRYLYLPEVKGNPATFATGGGFTTNPGPMWSVAFGSYFGLPVTPSDAPGGGNNYAAGGARVTFENPANMSGRPHRKSPPISPRPAASPTRIRFTSIPSASTI
jgi:outer membrane lipase/esterase